MSHLKTKTIPVLFKVFLITVACSFVFAGCTKTKRARKVDHKGYLVDASILKEGGGR